MPSLADPESTHIARAAASLGDRHACRERVLDALRDILQFDADPELRAASRRRYLDLTDERNA